MKSPFKNAAVRSFSFLISVLFAVAMMLPSCSGNLHSPITKRHYRKGFNLDFAHKVKRDKPPKVREPEQNNAETQTTEIEQEDHRYSLYASADEDLSQFISPKESEKPIESTKAIIRKHSVKHVISRLSKPIVNAKKIRQASSRGEDELSLIWLIVVIVLVLWFIAFLMGGWGLGGLIHLLLLIALILLILWLFKII